MVTTMVKVNNLSLSSLAKQETTQIFKFLSATTYIFQQDTSAKQMFTCSPVWCVY